MLQTDDIVRCRNEPEVLLDAEAYVLPFPVREQDEMPKALRNIFEAGLARPGVILVQSPFDTDTYDEASVAPERFALAKHMHFSTLCKHLGAKEVSVEQVNLGERSEDTKLDVKAERVGASVQADVNDKKFNKFCAQMHLRDEFSGGPPDVDAAERLLRKTGLWSDPNMRTLLEMRRDGSNQLTTRKLVINLSSEVKSNLNVVGRLNIKSLVKASVDYDSVVSEKNDYMVTVLVKF